MKQFALDLANFLRRHYPGFCQDGAYRFSADLEIRDGEIKVEIPILTRMPDACILQFPKAKIKTGPLEMCAPPSDTT